MAGERCPAGWSLTRVELATEHLETDRFMPMAAEVRVAALMTKLHSRIFNLASVALVPGQELSPVLERAFNQIDGEIDRIVSNTQLSYPKS